MCTYNRGHHCEEVLTGTDRSQLRERESPEKNHHGEVSFEPVKPMGM